jgi:uncharacterized protein YggE
MKTKYVFIVCLIITLNFLSGCERNNNENRSTISVFGTGTVLAQPDIIQMGITLSNVAQTTQMAQEEVNRMVRQALAILEDTGIEENNIMTSSLNFRSEYEWTTRRILIGQRAEQRITFSVDNIDIYGERASEIIDRLVQINGIELNQINFAVKDNTEYFIRSRELAFHNAVEKANQYAELSNLKIVRVLNISENINQQFSPINNRFTNTAMSLQTESRMDDSSTILPTGELEITTGIFVEFLLE